VQPVIAMLSLNYVPVHCLQDSKSTWISFIQGCEVLNVNEVIQRLQYYC
jgi:hypothetical protein